VLSAAMLAPMVVSAHRTTALDQSSLLRVCVGRLQVVATATSHGTSQQHTGDATPGGLSRMPANILRRILDDARSTVGSHGTSP
jgi:hypothetical protein